MKDSPIIARHAASSATSLRIRTAETAAVLICCAAAWHLQDRNIMIG